MSYDITHIEVLKLKAWMHAADVKRLRKECDDLPELCFLKKDGVIPPQPGLAKLKNQERYRVKHLWWNGEGAGYTYEETFLKKIAPCIQGEVQIVIVWESGDSVSGLKIKDGVVTECDVKYKLVEKE